MTTDSQPIRVLHVFGRMGRGGAETWMMNVLRRLDRERFQFDYLVHRRQVGEYDEEIRSLGSSIHIIENHRNLPRYAMELRALVKAHRYDVIHSHVSFFSGYILTMAAALGMKSRIAHSHTSVPASQDSPLQTAYKQAMRATLHRVATRGFGCSAKAVEALFGPSWHSQQKYHVLLYGYDFDRFVGKGSPDIRARVRRELGLGEGDYAIGHIGRFVTPKNHDFIIELAAACKERGLTDYKFVLVGDGELRSAIEAKARERGIASMCVFTGIRGDIPELLASMDTLILPSLWEGFALAVLEAQAMGVPCIISDRVPDEAVVYSDQVLRKSISGGGAIKDWVEGLSALRAHARMTPEAALRSMYTTDFSIDRHVLRLQDYYIEEAMRSQAGTLTGRAHR